MKDRKKERKRSPLWGVGSGKGVAEERGDRGPHPTAASTNRTARGSSMLHSVAACHVHVHVLRPWPHRGPSLVSCPASTLHSTPGWVPAMCMRNSCCNAALLSRESTSRWQSKALPAAAARPASSQLPSCRALVGRGAAHKALGRGRRMGQRPMQSRAGPASWPSCAPFLQLV